MKSTGGILSEVFGSVPADEELVLVFGMHLGPEDEDPHLREGESIQCRRWF